MEPTLGFSAIESLTTLASQFTDQVGQAGPIIGGVLLATTGLTVGIKVFKFIRSKISA